MQMDFKPFDHLAGLMDCSHKCHRFFNHDKIWKGVHEVICGSLVACSEFSSRSNDVGGISWSPWADAWMDHATNGSYVSEGKSHFEGRSVIARM